MVPIRETTAIWWNNVTFDWNSKNLINLEKSKRSLEPLWWKGRKNKKNTFFNPLIPYNWWLRKQSGSNDFPFRSLHSWEKLWRYSEPFGEKVKKYHMNGHTDKVTKRPMKSWTDRGQFMGPTSKFCGPKREPSVIRWFNVAFDWTSKSLIIVLVFVVWNLL